MPPQGLHYYHAGLPPRAWKPPLGSTTPCIGCGNGLLAEPRAPPGESVCQGQAFGWALQLTLGFLQYFTPKMREKGTARSWTPKLFVSCKSCSIASSIIFPSRCKCPPCPCSFSMLTPSPMSPAPACSPCLLSWLSVPAQSCQHLGSHSGVAQCSFSITPTPWSWRLFLKNRRSKLMETNVY